MTFVIGEYALPPKKSYFTANTKCMRHLLILTMLLVTQTVFSQDKIGYTNIELLLAYMPEARVMEQQLDTYQKKLGEQLQVKEAYLQQKYQEYLSKKESGQLSAADIKTQEAELLKLDNEVTNVAAESEQKLLTKRQELLNPILQKLQKAIDDVAAEKNYTVILNQTTSAGVSTILAGPDERDCTEAVMEKLGIEIPKGN